MRTRESNHQCIRLNYICACTSICFCLEKVYLLLSSEHGGVQSRLDLHGHQLLQEQLAGVRDPDLADILCRVAPSAMILELFQVRLAEQSTRMADMDSVAVGHIEEPLLQEPSRSMTNHTVSLHFSETKSTIPGSSLSWLSCQDLSRSPPSSIDLVSNHMLQSLIVGGTQEDENVQLLTSEPTVHGFVSMALIPQVMQLLRDELNCLALERRSISLITIETGHLAEHALHQVTNSHTGGNSVRIDNHVRNHTFNGEWKILLPVGQSTSSFLSVTTRKLISNLGHFDGPHFDFD